MIVALWLNPVNPHTHWLSPSHNKAFTQMLTADVTATRNVFSWRRRLERLLGPFSKFIQIRLLSPPVSNHKNIAHLKDEKSFLYFRVLIQLNCLILGVNASKCYNSPEVLWKPNPALSGCNFLKSSFKGFSIRLVQFLPLIYKVSCAWLCSGSSTNQESWMLINSDLKQMPR